jgi:hypothetical protein
MWAPSLPATSGLAASKSATGSSTPRRRRRRCSAGKSGAGGGPQANPARDLARSVGPGPPRRVTSFLRIHALTPRRSSRGGGRRQCLEHRAKADLLGGRGLGILRERCGVGC